MSERYDLSRPRGVYPDRQSAVETARRLPRGFVRTESETKHVVYEAMWDPLTIGRLSVDVEHETGVWRVVIAAQDDALLDPGVMALGGPEVRWLAAVALPAAIALIDRIEIEHDARLGALRW